VTTVDWTAVRSILDEALDRPASERSAFVSRSCLDDHALRAEVERLLRFDAADATFLLPPIDNIASHLLRAADDEGSIGDQIGRYRLERVIASGGMGIVYLGVRERGDFEHRVAVKILARSLDSPEAQARFDRERRILARLNHPGITTLIDGGATRDGRPYLVMEFVHGRPITEYAAGRMLDLRERLHLFLQVCDAVQFAHSNLIVHRDIKPANIMMTDDGRAKLLDFGVSKLIDADESHTIAATRSQPMTLRYSSPEQVRGGAVSTATDIYSLGVVLHELLTGAMPYDVGASIGAACDVICHEQPKRPSTLNGELNSELDAIILHALEKDPARRYDTVEAMAADIRRHLSGRTVLAHPPTRLYLFRKLLHRHRWPVALALCVFLLITVSGATAGWLALQLSRERGQVFASEQQAATARDQAIEINEFLAATLVSADPLLEGGRDLSALKMLRDASNRLESFASDPDAEAAIHVTLARAYLNLHLVRDAEPHVARAIAIYEQRRNQFGLAEALTLAGEVSAWQFDYDEAERIFRRALEMRPVPERIEPSRVLPIVRAVARRGAHADAIALADQAVADALARGFDCTELLDERAIIFAADGDREAAARALDEALANRPHPESDPDAVELGAWVYRRLGEHQRAFEFMQRAHDMRAERLDETDPLIIESLSHVGSFHAECGRTDEADRYLRKAVDLAERMLPEWHRLLRYVRSSYAGFLIDQGRFDEAEDPALAAYEGSVRLWGEDHVLTNFVRRNLIRLYDGWGRPGDADRYRISE